VKGELFDSESLFIKAMSLLGFIFLVGIAVLFVVWKFIV
jgi:hypothetical protein